MTFVLLCALLAAVSGVAYVLLGTRRPAHVQKAPDRGMFFLFRDCDLEHASPEGVALLTGATGETDWHALRSTLAARFPNLPDDNGLRTLVTTTITAQDPMDHAVVHLAREDEIIRVAIAETDPDEAPSAHTIRSLQSENSILRLAADQAPYPIWVVNDAEYVVWCNNTYAALAEENGVASIDTDDSLFPLDTLKRARNGSVRATLKTAGDDVNHWYDVTAIKSGTQIVCHAVDINAVIQAEVAQRNFVQTLAKTFAQLSIGLAIFDRNRQLALFNPAIVDLTSLPVEFLSARPDLSTFFDRLRDNRVMPEPKNYNSWRQEISNVIAAATHGNYQETWTLDTGHTYRVSGRPHPDGAVAFLIEDITAEIALTRNFRAELELGQSMMDTFDDALVVFSAAGVLTFCNAAYRSLWKLDPDNSFADVTIVDSLRAWQDQCDPDPDWGDMRDFVMKLGERQQWTTTVLHTELGPHSVSLSPIVSGATVVRFNALAGPRMPSALASV